MITAAGSGYSRWHDLTVTRWHEDATCDSWGTYIFLRDARSGDMWSAGYQPTGVEPDSYEAAFFEDRAEIVRRDKLIETKMEIAVSPEDDAEVRRVSISNLGTGVREIELTSYAEVVLAPDAADAAHPAFSNLFVRNGVRRRHRRYSRNSAAAVACRSAALGGAHRSRRRRGRGRPAIRD